MKSVLITGAGGNLGRAVTNVLAKDHYLYVTLGIGEDPGFFGEHADKINIEPDFINLTDEVLSESYIQRIIQEGNTIEAAILLVGGWQKGNVTDSHIADIDKMIKLNFITSYNVVRPLVEHFKSTGKGRFIFIGARPSINPADAKDQFAYSISKSMVIKMAEIINHSYPTYDIQAHVIIPSVLDTPQNRASMPEVNPSIWVQPNHIAETIQFLLSAAGDNLRETIVKVYNKA